MMSEEDGSSSSAKSDVVSISNLSGPGGSGLVRLQPSQVRLPSLKPRQDLTLGKVQKKVFTPTIPTDRRIKREPNQSVEKPVKKESKLFSNERRGRKKERKDVIKSESVFSMGPAGKSVRGRGSIGVTTAGTNSGNSLDLIKKRPNGPNIVNDSLVFKEEMQEQEEELGLIPRENGVPNFFKDSALPPCQLPLEHGDSITAAELLAAPHTLDGSCSLMQLPDCLPISPHESGASEEKDGETNICNIPEGCIGKLRIHKSGKVSLSLGEVSLDVSMGTPSGFLQELVRIHSSAPDPKMTSVGLLSHRLVCTPDFEDMLSSNQ